MPSCKEWLFTVCCCHLCLQQGEHDRHSNPLGRQVPNSQYYAHLLQLKHESDRAIEEAEAHIWALTPTDNGPGLQASPILSQIVSAPSPGLISPVFPDNSLPSLPTLDDILGGVRSINGLRPRLDVPSVNPAFLQLHTPLQDQVESSIIGHRTQTSQPDKQERSQRNKTVLDILSSIESCTASSLHSLEVPTPLALKDAKSQLCILGQALGNLTWDTPSVQCKKEEVCSLINCLQTRLNEVRGLLTGPIYFDTGESTIQIPFFYGLNLFRSPLQPSG